VKNNIIHTYEEATQVIKEMGFLPLAQLIPGYPSLDSMTAKEQWHTSTEFDPWLWRAQFPVDGAAAYGKFVKKKSVLISSELLPLVKAVLGSRRTLKERYQDGLVSREALELFELIRENEGIDKRVLRVQAGMKEKEKKKSFDNALLELQGSMDIVVAGTKAKTNDQGEKNGWSSTAFETMEHWCANNRIDETPFEVEDAKMMLKDHFASFCSEETMKAFAKIFKF
jgi:hypothetical protein